MNWEKLTAPEFKKASAETGVCIIAFGVLERHGDHLPLGTDYLNGHRLATLAAEKEKAVVFPPFYFGQIYEARCFPGRSRSARNFYSGLSGKCLTRLAGTGLRK